MDSDMLDFGSARIVSQHAKSICHSVDGPWCRSTLSGENPGKVYTGLLSTKTTVSRQKRNGRSTPPVDSVRHYFQIGSN